MGEMPSAVSSIVWIAWTLGVVVALSLQTAHTSIHALRWEAFWSAVALLVVFAVCVVAVVYAASRRFDWAIRVGFLSVLTVFGWSTLRGVTARMGVGGLATILTVGIAVVLWYAVTRMGRSIVVAVAAGVVVTSLVVVEVSSAVKLKQESQAVGSVVTSIDPPHEQPDVLIVVLDAHPRVDTAAAFLGADIRPFVSQLGAMGFSVNNSAVSNYDQSFASISSMLALDTLVDDKATVTESVPLTRGANGGDGELFRTFKRAGYRVAMAPSAWNGSRCGPLVDECASVRLLRSTGYWLLRRTPLAPLAPDVLIHPWTDTSMGQLESLAAIHLGAANGDAPVLTWVHVALPHGPVHVDANCGVVDAQWRRFYGASAFDEFNDERRSAFADQIACVDAIVVEQLELIMEEDPSTVVVLLSDHGPDSQFQWDEPLGGYSHDQLWERMSILNAVRVPDRCSIVEERRSPVGVLRELTACLLGAELSKTSEHFYVVPQETEINSEMVAVRIPIGELP